VKKVSGRNQVQISLNEADRHLLDNLAEHTGLSRSAFVRLMMQHFLATEKSRQLAVCVPLIPFDTTQEHEPPQE